MWTLLLLTTLFTLLLLFPSSAAGATTCSSSQISCDGICAVPCDGIVECTNREDETSERCQGTKCSNGPSLTMGELGDLGDIFSQAESNAGVEFQCDYGGCIPVFFACNGGINCWDGSDETQEACTAKTCKKRYHHCDYGGCIRERWICNGLKNCADGSDETAALCKNKACGSKFKCDYGGCIDPRKKCNGIVDCNDSSDETKELCGPNHIVQGASPSTSTPTLPVTQPPPPPVTQPPPPVTQPQPVTRPLSGTPGVIFPVVTEPSTDQCSHSGRCACPAPNNHFCAPCGDLSACDRINEVGVCSTEIIGRWDTKVSIDVLSCGVQPILNVVGISRNQGEVSCGLNNKVPVLSVVTAECWGTTVLAECRADGLWHAYGGIHNSTVPSRYLCQPQEVNSPQETCITKNEFQHLVDQNDALTEDLGHLRQEIASLRAELLEQNDGSLQSQVDLHTFIQGQFENMKLAISALGTVLPPSTTSSVSHSKHIVPVLIYQATFQDLVATLQHASPFPVQHRIRFNH